MTNRVQLVRLKRCIGESTEFLQIAAVVEQELSYRISTRGIDDLLNYLSMGSCYSGLRRIARRWLARIEMRGRLKDAEGVGAFDTILAIDQFLSNQEKQKILRLHHRWVEQEKKATRPEHNSKN